MMRRAGWAPLALLAGCGGGELRARRANAAPTAMLVVPVQGGDLVAGAASTLVVLTGDDRTPVEDLSVGWAWDGGDPIAGTAGRDGSFSTLVLPEALPPGTYGLVVQVDDGDGGRSRARATFRVVEPVLPDADLDGHGDAAAGGDDCNDSDPAISPDGTEVCNGLDDDCDGLVDEGTTLTGYPDGDGDGYGDPDAGRALCALSIGWLADAGDCDDSDPAVHPGADERCNGRDDDCSGAADDDGGGTWYADADGDGFGDPTAPLAACEAAGGVLDATDCHDDDALSRWCRSCRDVRAAGLPTADGVATLGADDVGEYDAWCDFSTLGGDWTLVATNAWAGGWDPRATADETTLGAPSLVADHKSAAWTHAPFTDVRFDNGDQHAIYEGMGDGTGSWLDFQRSVPALNCGPGTAHAWAMTAGTLSGDALCSTDLYVHPSSWWIEEGACHADLGRVAGMGWGPTWSVGVTGEPWRCPLQGPHTVTFATDLTGQSPWGQGSPLRMYVR